MNIEQYEIDFFRDIEKTFKKLLRKKGVRLPKKEVGNLYSLIVEDFLGLDTIEIQEIFEQRYTRQLQYYFNDNYAEDKIIIFIAFLSHLVLDENLGLFFPRIEPTGKHYGNWAIGYPRDKEFGKLVTHRIQYSHGREGITDFYFDAYLNLSGAEFKRLIQSSVIDKIEEKVSKSKDKEAKNLLQALLGASVATILLSTIAKFAEHVFRVWIPSKTSTQAMLSVGYAPGSLKFYGFCMEKAKSCPDDDTYYRPTYRENLSGDLASTYDRIPQFVKLFIAFMNSTDPTLLSLASKHDGDKIWHALQNFLWLITQPYTKSTAKVNVWQDFTEITTFSLSNLEPIQLEDGLDAYKAKIKHKLDNDMIILIKKCLAIMEQEGITVHESNIQLLNELIEKTN